MKLSFFSQHQLLSRVEKVPRSSFTVIELLIVAAIFAIVMIVAATSILNITRAHRRLVLQDYVFVEARHLMERLAREVYQNTVDWEEYNSHRVEVATLYGDNYGTYGKKFYNPGSPVVYGCSCSNDSTYKCPSDPSCIVYRPSVDTNTGQNQYAGSSENLSGDNYEEESAFAADGSLQNTVDELYLIDATGTKKTMVVRELINSSPEYGLSIVRMDGSDSDDDGDVDTWQCDGDFSCTGSTPENDDKSDPGTLDNDFVLITPRNINVTGFNVIVMPQEDPYKAFAEAKAQLHPQATIILTITPTQEAKRLFRAQGVQPVTLQTTISSQVRNEVKSFRPAF